MNDSSENSGQWVVGSEEIKTAHCPLPTAHCPLSSQPRRNLLRMRKTSPESTLRSPMIQLDSQRQV